MESIFKISRIFGICTWETPSRFRSFYQTSILCATICISVVSIYSIGNDIYSPLSTMHAVINLLTLISTAVQGIVIQIAFLVYAKTWNSIAQELNIGKEKYSLKDYFELFFIHFMFIGRLAWNTFITVAFVGWKPNLYNVYRTIHEYYGIIAVVMIVHTNLAIKKQFCSSYKVLFNPSILHHEMRLRQFEKSYRKLLQLADKFNKVFGYQILFITAWAITALLESLCISLKFFNDNMSGKLLILIFSVNTTIFALVIYIHITNIFLVKLYYTFRL